MADNLYALSAQGIDRLTQLRLQLANIAMALGLSIDGIAVDPGTRNYQTVLLSSGTPNGDGTYNGNWSLSSSGTFTNQTAIRIKAATGATLTTGKQYLGYFSHWDNANSVGVFVVPDATGTGTGDLWITGLATSGATTGYIRTVDALDATGSTPGNTRGAGAVDFQMVRTSATQIASGPNSVLLGGYGLNTASGDYSMVIGGDGNTVSGTNSFIIGSVASTITNHNSAIIGGRFSTSAGFSTFIGGGESCVTDGDYTAAFGLYAKSTLDGQFAQADGRFAATGDAQTSVLVAKVTTTNSSVTDLLLNAANLLTIPTDTTWAFNALIVGRRTDADNESAAYQLLGCIDNNAGTVALVGSVAKTVIAEDNVAWDATAVAGATNLIFQVTGQGGKNIYWVARVELTQVTG